MIPLQLAWPAPLFAVAVAITVIALGLLKRYFLLFSLVALPSTIFHELTHFLAALATAGRPAGINLIPRQEGNRYTMGSVMVRNARWWNCTVIGMAPVTLLGAAYLLATSKFGALSFSVESASAVYLTASLVHGSIPSPQDFKVAFGSPGVWIVMGLTVLYFASRYFR